MKRFLLFALAVIMFAACSKDAINEQQNMQTIVDEAPETLVVGFEESDETRIQLNEDVKTVWTNGDLVSVFYRSDANQQWHYTGETGARTAELKRVDAGTASRDMDRVVIVYPYNEGYYINPSTYNVQASLPTVQTYLEDSYGLDGNIMISSSEYNQFSLKSVCGWLKLQLTGNGEKVKSITLRGNNGEQVAGELYINSADATSILASDSGASDDDSEAGGSLIFEDTILTEVTLDCSEGVELGAEATAFYIALPPQTFANGFTVEIECDGYKPMILSTSNTLTIERNTIQPMASVEHNANPIIPYNEIHYTATSKVPATYWYVGTGEYYFGVNVVSHEWDSSTNKGIITFNGNVTKVAGFKDCYSLTGINLPDCVTSIGSNAFMCSGLKEIVIPESVTSIGSNAFYECKLTSIIIPKNVVSIGYHAFYHCYSLVDLYSYAILPPILAENAFVSCPKNVHVYEESLNLYKNWISFINYVSLGNIPANTPTTSIHYTTSDGAAISSSKFVVKSNSYRGDSGEMVVYGDLLFIPESAFSYNNTLTSITIPQSVTKIGCYAFKNCGNLSNVYCKSVTPPALLSDDDGDRLTFDNNHAERKIYVPAESVEAYRSATGWSKYASAIVGYNF